ncbi:MAG: DNA primase [Patescibacteria group bacterium]
MLDQVQEIKEKIDIVETISSYLTLKKAGVNYKANCPFHNEKSPSFMVNPERQTFKCFGCGEGGDVFTFVEKMEGLDFYNTLKLLAERAGVELKTHSIRHGNNEYKADQKTRIFEINEWAKKVYHKVLVGHPNAEKAREYLRQRGLSDKTIEEFEIGYAPSSWDFLLKFLKSKGYTEKEAVESGVAIKAETGKIYDRFRGRITFPISNIMGNTVAFTSRILVDDGKSAKYINSAESPIYIKGKTIYALDKAKTFIKEEKVAVMVEGQMDVIACHQAGFRNVIATSGTALTIDQLKILTRYAPDIAFCFDMDNAGQTAMKRAIRMALSNDISIKIIVMPDGFKDPDEAIKADQSNWINAVKSAKPSLQYWIDQLVAENSEMTIDQKKKIAKEILPIVKIISSEIEKEYYIKYLSEQLGTSQQSLIQALQRTKEEKDFIPKNDQLSSSKEKLSVLERILGLVWAEPKLLSAIGSSLEEIKAEKAEYQYLLEMIKKKEINREKVKPEITTSYDQLAITAIQDLDSSQEDALLHECQYLLGRLRSDQKESLKENFAQKIREAEQKGDKETLKKLLADFSTLIK